MPNLVFIDTETTGLRPDRRAWDIALIVREPDGAQTEYQWFINAGQLDLGNADPFGLKVGRFYERHPQFNGTEDPWSGSDAAQFEDVVLREVEVLTRGAHLVGAVPNFDADVLDTRMRANGIAPSWHYHLVDVETLAIGFLAGRGEKLPDLPWKSDDLSRAVGVEPASDEDRHTALGDARWAMRIYDAITAPPTA